MTRPARVGIVDNDPDVRISLSMLIGSLGYHPVSFETADELLHGGELESLDCVISDVQMPVIDGFELARRVRTIGSTPVLLVTGYASKAIEERASAAGARRVFTKPFDTETLIDELTQILGSAP